MFRRRASQLASRAPVQAAIPLRNPAVRETVIGATQMRLTAPLRQNAFTRLFGTRAGEKSFDLDDMGRYVWRACDGQKSIEQIIAQFAEAHRVNPRQAEVFVIAFLRTLLQRNLIALQVPSLPAAPSAP